MIKLLEESMRQHQMGQLDEAERGYKQVLVQSPGNVDALHFMGVLLHQKGDSKKGAQSIRKAISRSPEYADAHKNLGNVLQESGMLEKAERCYRAAIQLQPDDADAHTNLSVVLRLLKRNEESIEAGLVSVNNNAENPVAWLNFGKALKAGGMLDSAVEAFYRALKLDGQFVEVHNELCQTLYRAEKISEIPEAVVKERIDAYREWLKSEPENPVINFMLAACNGDLSFSRAPDDVVKNLFDGFASSFDQTLARLNYRVPGLIENRLRMLYPYPESDLKVLDAGCGTGLCAAFLRPLAQQLVGVDLSSGMLKLARRRGLYDQLIEGELTTRLQQDGQKYDLIICADTFCYFGGLEAVFFATTNALKAAGRFIFSVELLEHNNSRGYRINTSGRYSHTRNYICEKLAHAGMTLVSIDEVVLREESASPVAGLIVESVLSA